MKFRLLIPALLLVLSLASCKKEETTKEYMTGLFDIDTDMPTYVTPGSVYSLSVSGVKAPDGTAVGYSYQAPISQKTDTVDVYKYTVPDTLGTFGITITAYAIESSAKYYPSSTTLYFTVVGDESIKGLKRFPGAGAATLHSRKYETYRCGDREWIGANLSYIDRDDSGKETFGHSYAGCPAMQDLLGAYYTWEEAQNACPEGWHLPSDAEWVEAIKQAGGPADLQPMQDSPSGAGNLMVKATFNGSDMWEYYRGVNVQNATHLSVLPTGYANVAEGRYRFYGFMSYAVFWTSSDNGDKGVYRYIYQEYDNVYCGLADKDAFAASVRCIR
ncbi:MAG: hypothetical protein IK031_01255 [Bacteroidales bacterium]|nr:hypothetical protein [Bacteroidales bacterium]